MAQLANTVITGALRVVGDESATNLNVTNINGVAVGSSPKFTDNDTKVTSVANHYTPTCSGTFSASASGATAAWSIDVVKGVTLQKDAAGHITGVSVTSGKIPANPNTDTKVTAVANHYTPACSGTFSASASGATAAWSIDVVKGVTLQKDAAGHITGISVTSGKIPANPNTDTKVTAVANHYTPACSGTFTASATGGSAAWSIDVVQGVTLQKDAAGHITGVSVTSGKIPANPNTDTKVTQNNDTANSDYRVLLSASANNTNETTTAKKSGNFIANPSTGLLTVKQSKSTVDKSMLTGSGTAAQDKGSSANPRYFPAKWTFNTGLTVADGDIFTIKIPVAGHDYGVFLSVNNGTNYYPVGFNTTSRLTTHFPINETISVVFKSDGQVNDIYAVAGANGRSNVTGGAFYVLNFYDSGNTYDRNRYNATILAWGTKILNANIIVAANDGKYHHLKEGTAFDIRWPILYLVGDCNANTGTTNTYDIIHFTITTTQSISLTAYKPVYIKGTLSGTTFTPVSTTPLTQTVPTAWDGYAYILLGMATASTSVYLQERHPIYKFYSGVFREWNDFEGGSTTVSGAGSHAEGSYTTASGGSSHAEGLYTEATGTSSHAEGYDTLASGPYSHAEGYGTTASADHAHAEGNQTAASGKYSHAEGILTKAYGDYSHAESYQTKAGNYAHAEGAVTLASGEYSHAEGYGTTASGSVSHAGGYYTCAAGAYQTVIGKYNTVDTTSLFIVGNGTANNARSNALKLSSDGDLTISKINTVKTASFIPTFINSTKSITSSTAFAYTGASVTIPAKSYYVICAMAISVNASPEEIGICTINSGILYPYQTLAYNSKGAGATLCSYTDSAGTLYVWARYSAANTNRIDIVGWYYTI